MTIWSSRASRAALLVDDKDRVATLLYRLDKSLDGLLSFACLADPRVGRHGALWQLGWKLSDSLRLSSAIRTQQQEVEACG